MKRFTEAEKELIWDRHQAGVPVKRIAREMGRLNCSLRKLVSTSGGIRPAHGCARSCIFRLMNARRSPRACRGTLVAGDRLEYGSIAIDGVPGGEPQRRAARLSGVEGR